MKRMVIGLLLALVMVSASAAGFWYSKYQALSGRFAESLFRSGVTVDAEVVPYGMTYVEREGRLFLDIRIVQGYLDEGAYLSPSGERLYMRYESLGFKTGDPETDNLLQRSLETLSLPILESEGERYVELEALAVLYRMYWQRSLQTGIINLVTHRAETLNFKVAKKTWAALDGIELFELTPGQALTAIKTPQGGLAVLSADGRLGYLEESMAAEISDLRLIPPVVALGDRKALDQVIGAWDQVHRYTHNFNFSPAEGAGVGNVIMPTWFDLNVEGIVLNLADMAYVRSAQEAGWQVWGLYANHFNPAWTSEMLRSETLTDRTIAHVVAYAVAFGLDGINIDFENMYLRDQDLFTAYVVKLSEALRRVGKWVSIDVTVPEGSDQWSKVYDRVALSRAVDYVFLMAYDEHWAASPVAGSVASRDWVVQGIEKSLALIPREKLLLGMPLYTRIWEESGGKVTSSTLGYGRTAGWLAERNLNPVWDEKTGQNVVQYQSPRGTVKVWLEDRRSLEMRLDLMERYQLPGLGLWSIDFANDEVWTVIEER